MAWKQLKDANWKIPYVGGWCEGYVEGSFGQATLPTIKNQTTSGTWPSAMAKWNANPGNGNHPNELPPVGKTVPVYFSLGSTSYGHTAISLDDGKVASSTQSGFHTQGYIHPNLQDLINLYAKYNNGCSYLGWSEYVGTVHVVEYIQDSQPTNNQGDEDMIDLNTLNVLFNLMLGRNPDADAINHYVGHYTTSFVVDDLNRSSERATRLANIANEQNNINTSMETLKGSISILNSNLETEKEKSASLAISVSELTTRLDDSNKLNGELQKKIDTMSDIDVKPATEPVNNAQANVFVNFFMELFNKLIKRSK